MRRKCYVGYRTSQICWWVGFLPLKRQSRIQQTAFINIFSLFFREIRLDVSSESSARQRIHMKNQALFSSKDKSKTIKCRLPQFLFGALRGKPSFGRFANSADVNRMSQRSWPFTTEEPDYSKPHDRSLNDVVSPECVKSNSNLKIKCRNNTETDGDSRTKKWSHVQYRNHQNRQFSC